MKIALQQLSNHLIKNLAPIYLISGDEYLLVDDVTKQIRETAKKFDFLERDIFQVDSGFDWENLLLKVSNLSLFDDKSIVELHIQKLKIGDTGSTVLQTYAANPPADKLLLIVTGKLDAATQNSAWFKSIDSAGIILQIWPIELSQLPGWIANRARNMGLQLSTESAQLLIDHTEGNMLAVAQEMEKLLLLYGKGKLEVEQLVDVITSNSRFDVFELLSSMLSGDAKRITKVLTGLQDEYLEPAIILWAITKELRLLINIATSNQEFNNLEHAMQAYKVHFSKKILFKNVLQKYTIKNFENSLRHAAKIDLIIKGAAVGNVWHELLHLCLDFCKKVS